MKYQYTGNMGRVTPCEVDFGGVCEDGSCPGEIDGKCPFSACESPMPEFKEWFRRVKE